LFSDMGILAFSAWLGATCGACARLLFKLSSFRCLSSSSSSISS
jgi:hypothetical protein